MVLFLMIDLPVTAASNSLSIGSMVVTLIFQDLKDLSLPLQWILSTFFTRRIVCVYTDQFSPTNPHTFVSTPFRNSHNSDYMSLVVLCKIKKLKTKNSGKIGVWVWAH